MGCGLSKQKSNKIQSSDTDTIEQKVNRRRVVHIDIIDETLIYRPKSMVGDLKIENYRTFALAHRISRLIDKSKLNKMLPR